MFSRKIFHYDFKTVLEDELRRTGMSIKDLSEKAGIPSATIYKITSGERDPRFSTIKAICAAFEPSGGEFVAVIGAKFLLDDIETKSITAAGKEYRIKGYPSYSLEECIVSAVKAEKDGAGGIVCAPVLASLVERIVDIPVVIMKPGNKAMTDSIKSLEKRLE